VIDLEMKGAEAVLAALEPPLIEEAIIFRFGEMTRFAASITPVRTGAMQRAWKWEAQGWEGRMFIDPSARNPRSGVPVTDYAEEVDQRYGILDKALGLGARMGVEDVEWPIE